MSWGGDRLSDSHFCLLGRDTSVAGHPQVNEGFLVDLLRFLEGGAKRLYYSQGYFVKGSGPWYPNKNFS